MKDLFPIVGFFLIIALFSHYTGGEGIFNGQNTASSTRESWTGNTSDYTERLSSGDNSIESPRQLSSIEIEYRLKEIQDQIGSLKEEVRRAKLLEPRSPYQGFVELERGNVWEERWSHEYVTLRASEAASGAIDITGWSLESYVTRERSKIPTGDRVIESYGYPVFERILLLPGEYAYVISGRSPIKTSFHENICTGYFAEEKEFMPYLNQNCPSPISEMKSFSGVAYTNDACYDFVENLPYCRTVDEETLDEVRISNTCERFVEKELTYDACVENHKNDPLFDNTGNWYIYLGRTRDLWRSEREIIRLLDHEGRVVDVIEY